MTKSSAYRTSFALAQRPVPWDLERLLEPMQIHVRQQGGDHSSLGRSLLGSLELGPAPLVAFADRRLKPHPNQLEHRSVRDPDFQALHQLIVRDRVKVRFQVGVVHFSIAVSQMLGNLVERLVGRATGTESERTVQKVRLEDRFQDQQHCRLHDPVFDRGNTQWSQPAVRLRYVRSLDRLGTIAFGAKLFPQFLQELGRAGPLTMS